MKIKLLFTLFILSTFFSDLYSQISTDRPNQTESPFTLPSGHIQIETGILIEDSQSNINTLFRIGIINGIEVRLNSNYLMNDNITVLKKSSFSDFEVGAKFKIWGKSNDKTKIGFFDWTGNLNTFTFFLSINFINSPPFVIIKDLQPFSGRKCAKSKQPVSAPPYPRLGITCKTLIFFFIILKYYNMSNEL